MERKIIKTRENIRNERRKLGVTQEELSDILGVGKNSVGNWESGKNEPNIYSLVRMAETFNISLDELVFGG